ncbi:nuclear transport factor 2 family protein [Streptomyces sp. WAC01526]|uniref:nuclear transport factor 2 family protein n=1 Tax=unclassified Streptomyces TaxID=2593676 RepID=UPI0011DFE196|nr:nuclear transport factor 2 family protein [Streptomyces sp. WAC01526]MCW7986678.1 phenazine biosynthesis protein PhzA/PhzB [Streptomyces platensis subsp. clarensis]
MTPTTPTTTTTPTAPTTPTPAELYRHGLQLLLDKNMDAWVALCDDHAVFEFPFAPDGYPKRLEGRAAIAAYLQDYPDHIDLQAFPHLEIHGTDSPDTIVVEMRATGRFVATGAPYEMSYIAVVTVVGGCITHYRDYWNPLAIPASMSEAKSPLTQAP